MRVQKNWIGALIALALMFALPAAAEEILLRDEWCVLEQDGIPGGFSNDQYLQTEDGYHYRGFFQVNMDVLGTPFLYLEQMDAWVDKDHKLTKIVRVSDVDGAQTRHEAVFSYSDELTEANVTDLDTTGETNTSYWNWVGLRPIYTASSYIDKLIAEGDLHPGGEHDFEIWNYGVLEPTVCRLEEQTTIDYGGREVPVYKFYQKSAGIGTTIFLDHEGITYRAEAPENRLMITKVEEGDLPEFQAIASDVLLVISNIVVEHPYRSTSSLITVEWQDLELEEFSWEDNRQSIAQILTDTSVQLKIAKDQRDFSGLITLPVTDVDFGLFLADTNYITPSQPRVQTLVQDILAGETDAYKAAQLILDWVFQNITAKMEVRTLTTTEILESRSGKCAEFATLFAALARAAGLPTRIALGERYQGNIWVGHLWNEVWLGEWVAVDPSHNQISPDALLIKFIDSDSIMGTQYIRMSLVNKLQITIDQVEVPPPAGETGLETGLDGERYSNAQYSCQVSMPADWLGLEAEEQGFPMFVMYDPAYEDFSAVLLMMSVPVGSKAEQLMDSRIIVLPSALPHFELREQRIGQINGQQASVASWTFNDIPVFVQENQILVADDVAYLFVFTGPAETWDEQQTHVAAILDSFINYP